MAGNGVTGAVQLPLEPNAGKPTTTDPHALRHLSDLPITALQCASIGGLFSTSWEYAGCGWGANLTTASAIRVIPRFTPIDR